MRNSSFIFPLGCITGIIISFIFISITGFSNVTYQNTLERRVAALEDRVSSIERSIDVGSQRPNYSIPQRQTSTNIDKWRELETGMSKQQVQNILGIPPRKSNLGHNMVYWNYHNGGRVLFTNGRVSSWSEPI